MTPSEASHLCACETLALADSGLCSREDMLVALRYIRNLLAAEIKATTAEENVRKAETLVKVIGAKKKPRTVK